MRRLGRRPSTWPFKWDITNSTRGVVSRYVWHRGLSGQGIADRLADIYGGHTEDGAFSLARDVLQLALERVPAEALRYLEVTEDETRRRSFALNLYPAGFQVQDFHPHLLQMCQHHVIFPELFGPLYDHIQHKTFGHLAGGWHRDGQDFFNVYYGVEGRPG